MHVFWFVNIPLPAVLRRLGRNPTGSGWWLVSLLDQLVKNPTVKLTVANCDPKYPAFEEFEENGIKYLMIPASHWNISGLGSNGLVKQLSEIVNKSGADIVDVRGSEYVYGQITPFINKPVLITIQLFMQTVAARPYGNKNFFQVLTGQTCSLKDIKDGLALAVGHAMIHLRVKSEEKIFKVNKYFAGRTDWDRQVAFALATNLQRYFSCWEIMRKPFYLIKWEGPKQSPKRIFACSRCEPSKGFHDLINIMPKLQSQFPDIELRLTADDKKTSWGRYLGKLASEKGVRNAVKFLGYLTGEQIAAELKASSLYVHATYLDNSPNSLAEAMCVGVPCVASTTGGIPSMITEGYNGLLFDVGNTDMLIEQICRILNNSELAIRLGGAGRITALQRHEPASIANNTLAIYDAVLADWRNNEHRHSR